MSPEIIGGIGFIVLFILMLVGIPLGVTMGLIGFAGLWAMLSFEAAFAKMAQAPFDFIANYSFAALPLFFLMGEVIIISGQGNTIFTVARKWFGRLPGGLSIATIAACAMFGTVSGSSIATSVTIGLVAIPQMLHYKYDPGLASGSVAAGGTIGSLIPPSTFLIIYGIITENSISDLFMGGIIPGILCAVAYSLVIIIRCYNNPDLGPGGGKTALKDKILSLKDIWEIIALGVLCLGGMMIGWFTATEAGAIGAAGAFLMAGIKGKLSWKVFKDILRESMKTLGMTYALLIGAYLFNYFCTVTRLPDSLSKIVLGLQLPAIGIMVAIIIIYLILGALMDEMSIQLLTTPIIYPIVTQGLGFDPIWFGIMQARLLQIGQVAPPVGIIVFIMRGLFKDIPITTMYRGVLWFLVADMFMLAVFVFWPSIILFLPNMMK